MRFSTFFETTSAAHGKNTDERWHPLNLIPSGTVLSNFLLTEFTVKRFHRRFRLEIVHSFRRRRRCFNDYGGRTEGRNSKKKLATSRDGCDPSSVQYSILYHYFLFLLQV